MYKRIVQLFWIFAFCLTATSNSFAQSSAANYPNKVVTLVVPFTSGSGSDTISRIISPKLSERWKQPVIVDNRAGASGNIGTDHAAKATPDGYTILMAIDTMTMTPAVYKTLPFDPIKDLDPIARLATSSYALAVTNTLPVKDVNSLLALIKSKPGQLNYGSPGNGTPHHLSMELLKSLKGVDIVHVPYKGIAGATTDLIGGQVQVMFATFNSMIPFAKAGKLKMIAVTGAKRSDLMPDVPTFTEQGIPELENLYPWYGVLVPAGTPKDIQNKIYNDFTAVMKLPEVEKQLNELGIQVRLSTGDQLKDIIQSDIARWKKVVKDANIQSN
jgi:tripartite-type tricarboxylate transporter receptor subunit TctC